MSAGCAGLGSEAEQQKSFFLVNANHFVHTRQLFAFGLITSCASFCIFELKFALLTKSNLLNCGNLSNSKLYTLAALLINLRRIWTVPGTPLAREHR